MEQVYKRNLELGNVTCIGGMRAHGTQQQALKTSSMLNTGWSHVVYKTLTVLIELHQIIQSVIANMRDKTNSLQITEKLKICHGMVVCARKCMHL